MFYIISIIALIAGAILIIGATRNWALPVDPPKSAAMFCSHSLLRWSFNLDQPATKWLTIMEGATLIVAATIIMAVHAMT